MSIGRRKFEFRLPSFASRNSSNPYNVLGVYSHSLVPYVVVSDNNLVKLYLKLEYLRSWYIALLIAQAVPLGQTDEHFQIPADFTNKYIN